MHELPPQRTSSVAQTPVTRATACVLAVLIAACSLQGGCEAEPASGTAKKSVEPIEVKLTPVLTLPAERYIDLTGTLFGEEDVTIAAKVPGRIIEINADLGDAVAHGEKLAQVETTDYVLAIGESRSALLATLARVGLTELPAGEIDVGTLPVVARARAQAANAEARLERARKLYDRSPPLISEQEFADIQTQCEVAKTGLRSEEINAQAQIADARVRGAALALAEQRLADATVFAPAELPLRYRVAARRVSVGEYVSAGTPLFRLVAMDRVKFRGSVPERFAQQISLDAPARLESEGYAAAFEARVVRISPAVNPSNRAFEIEIEAANPEQRLKPGSFMRARVRTSVDEKARFIPAAAILEFAGVRRLFAVREGKVVEFKVRTGDSQGALIEVLDLPEDVVTVVDKPRRGLVAGTPARVTE